MTLGLEHIRQFFASYRRTEIHNPALTRAGVLVLLFMKDAELHFLLTKRTEDVEHHKGQISFPGGVMDEDDGSIVETALRECREEIGLLPDAVQILGLFDDYETPSRFAVTPVVAYVPALPKLKPNKQEVADVLEVPISLFLDKANERIEQRKRYGEIFDVYFYRYRDHDVWGATAAIIRSFLSAIRDT
ncbi:MAG: CoA pyrophosphatase [Ignavibacteria bacterium]|nr:CoA pyrophosphatase [Ignavibacteria bacterium]